MDKDEVLNGQRRGTEWTRVEVLNGHWQRYLWCSDSRCLPFTPTDVGSLRERDPPYRLAGLSDPSRSLVPHKAL